MIIRPSRVYSVFCRCPALLTSRFTIVDPRHRVAHQFVPLVAEHVPDPLSSRVLVFADHARQAGRASLPPPLLPDPTAAPAATGQPPKAQTMVHVHMHHHARAKRPFWRGNWGNRSQSPVRTTPSDIRV